MIGIVWPLGRVTKEFSIETNEVKGSMNNKHGV